MPKRKRDGSEASASEVGGVEGGVSMREHRVHHKLDVAHKMLTRAFRMAKNLEAQKSGRRRKTAGAKSDAKEVVRIEAETAALKVLDLPTTARNYLYKSLIKFKAVAESPDLPKAVSTLPPPINDTTKANVIARLCNSNPVKEALPPLLKDIQRALGIEPKDVKAVKQGKKRLRAKDIEKLKQEEQERLNPQSATNHVEMGEPEDERDNSRPTLRKKSTKESESGSDDEFAQFNDRLAGSSDSEDGGEESDDEVTPTKVKASRAAALRAALGNISQSASASPSPSPSASPSPSPGPESPPVTTTKPATSAFVPSLTMGGYWSGSESEAEDLEEKQPKKNRRGQRARQAIAEQKFGKSAKHLQKQEKAGKNDRNSGWDSKRGATDRSGARGAPRARFERPGQDRGASNEGAAGPAKKKHRDDSGPLHPSWEAAKKAKEAKKVMASFEGKKITFD